MLAPTYALLRLTLSVAGIALIGRDGDPHVDVDNDPLRV
jgi:hypothetical protein